MKKTKLTIIRPGGNDTALIEGIPPKSLRKSINDEVMKKFPSIEQVGFYTYSKNNKKARLEMAGGEFCGNATRSLAYLLLEGRKGTLDIKVSGTKDFLKTGIKKPNTAFAQMPIYEEEKRIRKVADDIYMVPLKGITQVITALPAISNEIFLKKTAREILDTYNLLSSVPAAGVMFISEINGKIQIDPIVWVRDIQTFFYETACASGTTAVGLYLAKYKNLANKPISIVQPSGSSISIIVQKESSSLLSALIDGPIAKLDEIMLEVNL